jgi:uncharacterized membrane protein
MRIALGSLALVLAAACQPASELSPPEPEGAAVEPQATDPAPPAGPVVIGGVELARPIRALGTEPFWGVEIKPDELVYSGVDRPETKIANPGPRMEGANVVIAAMDAGGEAFTVTLRDAECSDGMSDRVYPLEAEVKYKGETLKGCAISQAAMDAGPKP